MPAPAPPAAAARAAAGAAGGGASAIWHAAWKAATTAKSSITETGAPLARPPATQARRSMKISSCRWSRKWPFCAFSATRKARTSTVAPLSCESVAPGIDAFHCFTHAGTRTAPTECDVSDSTQWPAAPFSTARRSSTCANAASDGGPSPTPLATERSSSVLIHGLWRPPIDLVEPMPVEADCAIVHPILRAAAFTAAISQLTTRRGR